MREAFPFLVVSASFAL